MSVQFIDNSSNVKGVMDKAIAAFLEEAAGEWEAQTKQNQRVDTGQTKGAWTHIVEGNTATVGNPLENAIWEEFGTGVYALGGDGRKTPWGYTDRQGKFHWTHGKRPCRAFYRASQSVQGRIAQRGQQVMNQFLGGG